MANIYANMGELNATVEEIHQLIDRLFIPLFIGFQHVSTIQGGAGFLPFTVLIKGNAVKVSLMSLNQILEVKKKTTTHTDGFV